MSPGDVVPYLTFPGAFAYPEQDAAAHDGSAAVGLGLPELLHSLRRQWLLGALIGLCFAAVAAAGMWFTQKPKHTSIAFLRISATMRR